MTAAEHLFLFVSRQHHLIDKYNTRVSVWRPRKDHGHGEAPTRQTSPTKSEPEILKNSTLRLPARPAIGKKRLAVPGGPIQKNTLGDACPDLNIFLRFLQKIDDS